MPSAAVIMKNWVVDCTWTPDAGLYAARTVALTYKAAASQSAYVAQMAQNQTQDMNNINPVVLSAPYLDPDQSW